MPQAISMAIRQSILSDYNKGVKTSSIIRAYNVSKTSIYNIIKRYKAEGEQGLRPRYDNCGKSRPNGEDFIYRAVRCLRTWHPSWGAEKIRAEMQYMRPELKLPHYRTFYKWFHWNGQLIIRPKSTLPASNPKSAKALHEIWQIDAKEEMTTLDGQKQCWLNIVDEFSGMVIDPYVFSL